MFAPSLIIGPKDNPYLYRWHLLPRNRFFGIYLHKIVRDDEDEALHDHAYYSLSIILRGAYREWINIGGELVGTVYKAGRLRGRRGNMGHRLEVVKGPVWTLFITGPRYREWGFHCPKGWIPWYEFNDPNDYGGNNPSKRRGCGE